MIDTLEYENFEFLVKQTEASLKQCLSYFCHNHYKNVIETKDYIVGIGDAEIALLAHLDTVHMTPVKSLYHDQEKDVLWSPEGLGADDRAGVYAAMLLVLFGESKGKLPHVIFTTGEELGGIGANALAQIPCPFDNLKYIIQLDRRGKDECVFYRCNNEDFIHYIESFGFKESLGTYTDISFICPAWKICGVNLSVGYENEHSFGEYLNFSDLQNTIQKVKVMLMEENIPHFEYSEFFSNICKCYKCGKEFKSTDLRIIFVRDLKGFNKPCCIDCLTEDKFGWCELCYSPFERNPNTPDSPYCQKCMEDLEQ
jgi:hypothetical protein